MNLSAPNCQQANGFCEKAILAAFGRDRPTRSCKTPQQIAARVSKRVSRHAVGGDAPKVKSVAIFPGKTTTLNDSRSSSWNWHTDCQMGKTPRDRRWPALASSAKTKSVSRDFGHSKRFCFCVRAFEPVGAKPTCLVRRRQGCDSERQATIKSDARKQRCPRGSSSRASSFLHCQSPFRAAACHPGLFAIHRLVRPMLQPQRLDVEIG